jgi:hypothetical protein
MLVPVHYRRKAALSMICNSFFKEWLLPGPSLDCPHCFTFFFTDTPLGDLNQWSGLFPSRPWTLAPRVCLPLRQIKNLVFGVFWISVRRLASFQTKVLYPYYLSETLYLHRFRRKPAKTKFEGISLLTATHPSILQHTLVRSSDRKVVNLVTVRSLGFGSKTSNSTVLFSYSAFTSSPPTGLNFARDFNLLAPYTKGTSLGFPPDRLFVTLSSFSRLSFHTSGILSSFPLGTRSLLLIWSI